MQKSFEDILREKMAQPVNVKGRDTTVLPAEAMVLSVMQNAMRGDISAIIFIRTMTDSRKEGSEEYAEEQRAALSATENELQEVLKDYGLPNVIDPTLEILARDLMTIRRVADTMLQEGHRDIAVIPQRNGSDKMEISTTNRIVNDLCKQWRKDWYDFIQQMSQIEMRRKVMKR